MKPGAGRLFKRFGPLSSRPARYLVAVAAFLGALLVRVFLARFLGQNIPYIFFFPAVVVSAWFGGFSAGLLTTGLSGLAALLLRFRTNLVPAPASAGVITFLLTGAFVSWLNGAFRRTQQEASRELQARREFEAQLQASEERLHLALDAGGGIATWDWDIPQQQIRGDVRFAQLFSFSPEHAAAGVPLEEFKRRISQEDQAVTDERLEKALTVCEDYTAEYRVRQEGDRQRWVLVKGRCHRNGEGNPTRLLGIAYDITERKHADAALGKAHRDLEEFSYVASHDLQEPLRMVSIYTNLLVRRLQTDDEEVLQFAAFVQDGVARMNTLIRDLLAYSRASHVEGPEFGAADLNAAFDEARSVLHSEIEEQQARIHVQQLPSVSGDTRQMAHVFQNLLSNALKYRSKDKFPELDIQVRHADGFWIVSVADNGIGFEPQYAEKIFGLFKRLHSHEYPGTGLGLAICQRTVERFGGRIWAEGKPGIGATFYLSLRPAPEDGEQK